MERILSQVVGKDIAREIMRYVTTHEKLPMKIWPKYGIGCVEYGINTYIDRIYGDQTKFFYWTSKWPNCTDLFYCGTYLEKLCYSGYLCHYAFRHLDDINSEIRKMNKVNLNLNNGESS